MSKQIILKVQDTDVRILSTKKEDYICITDIAKGFETGVSSIESWMRNRNTIEFLGTWEELNNDDFNSVGFDEIKKNVGLNTFKVSAKKWVNSTNAIGLVAKAGRYGGTYAHRDIAIQFCYWLSPVFQLYFIKEFQRLKEEEADRLKTDWNLKRQLAKVNFHIHSEAVREYLVPIIDWNTKRESIYQASETDLLNLALFGQSAKEWKAQNPKKSGNMRDYATAAQLLVLANLESINANLIKWETPKDQRLELLNETARDQMSILINNKSLEEVKQLGK